MAGKHGRKLWHSFKCILWRQSRRGARLLCLGFAQIFSGLNFPELIRYTLLGLWVRGREALKEFLKGIFSGGASGWRSILHKTYKFDINNSRQKRPPSLFSNNVFGKALKVQLLWLSNDIFNNILWQIFPTDTKFYSKFQNLLNPKPLYRSKINRYYQPN